MACPTCNREDVPETCGSKLGQECRCCGMTIIAVAESSEVIDEDNHNQGQEGSDSDSSQKNGNYLTRNIL